MIKKSFYGKVNILPALIAVLAAFSLIVTGCSSGSEIKGADVLMDTYVTYNFTPAPATDRDSLRDEIIREGRRLDKECLSTHSSGSEIAGINASAGNEEGYPLSEETEAYLVECFKISEESKGAFDITLGALTDLWGIDEAVRNDGEGFRIPSAEEIENAKKCCGYEKVKIEDHRIYLPEGMKLDLGAAGKGIYLDEVAKYKKKLAYGILSAGSSILTIGYKPGGDPWTVGIKDPADPAKVADTLKLSGDYVISTSGDYERFVEVNGIRYHHIIDGNTGRPARSGVASVTVVMGTEEGNGLCSDALSTAIFVLGSEKGLELAARYGAVVVIVTDDGQIIRSEK